jgi:hypothetical protein
MAVKLDDAINTAHTAMIRDFIKPLKANNRKPPLSGVRFNHHW